MPRKNIPKFALNRPVSFHKTRFLNAQTPESVSDLGKKALDLGKSVSESGRKLFDLPKSKPDLDKKKSKLPHFGPKTERIV
jgi:hypothetical protein